MSIEAVGFVENTEGSTIDTDSLTIVASYFNNLGSPSNPEGNVITDSFALSVAGDFNYEDDFFQNGNISGVSSQYFTARNGNFINPNNVDIRLTGDFGVTANNFFSTGEVIDVANLSIVVSEAFGNTADLTANSIYIEAEGNVSNASTIDADDLTIISNTGFFFNAGATIPGVGIGEPDTIVPTGDIITDRFTLSVATNHVNGGEDFDYREHLLDNGKITSLSSLNFTLTGDGHFTVSGDNIALTGDLGITANSFTNTNATIEANNVDIQTTTSFTNSGSTIETNNLTIDVGDNFANTNSTLIANNISIEAENYVLNAVNSTIEAADDLTIVAVGNTSSYLSNQTNSTIRGNNISIEATDYLLNTANSTIEAENLTINTREFYNVAAAAKLGNTIFGFGGNIIAANLTIETDTFSNINNDGDIDGNITADTFTLSVADDFDYRADYLNNGNISHANNQYLTVREGDFINNADIVLTGDLEITAEIIRVSSNRTISADNLSLVASNFLTNNDNSTIKGNNVSIEAGSYISNSNNSTIDAENLTINTSVFFNVLNATLISGASK